MVIFTRLVIACKIPVKCFIWRLNVFRNEPLLDIMKYPKSCYKLWSIRRVRRAVRKGSFPEVTNIFAEISSQRVYISACMSSETNNYHR